MGLQYIHVVTFKTWDEACTRKPELSIAKMLCLIDLRDEPLSLIECLTETWCGFAFAPNIYYSIIN